MCAIVISGEQIDHYSHIDDFPVLGLGPLVRAAAHLGGTGESSCGGASAWGLHMMGPVPVIKGLLKTEVMTVGNNDYIETREKVFFCSREIDEAPIILFLCPPWYENTTPVQYVYIHTHTYPLQAVLQRV